LTEIQDREPSIKENIDKVGIQGLRTRLKIVRDGVEFSHFPKIDVSIDLGADRKGIHMSRLVESINEVVATKTEKVSRSLEEFGNEVLLAIGKKHPYKKAEITIKSMLMLPRVTPVSKKSSNEPYDVNVRVLRDNGYAMKQLMVKVIGNTLCPHSLEITGGKTHIQRAEIQLGVLTDFDIELPLEKMIEICENCFSSQTYSVVKTDDEKFLVEQMYLNPKFVEDLARECFERVKELEMEGKVKIKATSYESIHKHNVISVIEREVNAR